ncbi:hypothetical protein LTR17_021076 [Elasticomyces elasticus]|nr:hypothetical protein LTR17_021076 [Elasticomyces elasticus]
MAVTTSTVYANDQRMSRSFGLPRENRNMIYSFSWIEPPLGRWRFKFRAPTGQGFLLDEGHPDMLCVCRQFKDEFEEQLDVDKKLVVASNDIGGLVYEMENDEESNAIFRRLRHVEIRIGLHEHSNLPKDALLDNAENDIPWLLTKLPALRTMHVQLEIDHEEFDVVLGRNCTAAQFRANICDTFEEQPLKVNGNITLTHEVIITGQLFEMVREYDDHTLTLEDSGRNWIQYRATLATDPQDPFVWRGLDLEMIGASEELDMEAKAELCEEELRRYREWVVKEQRC